KVRIASAAAPASLGAIVTASAFGGECRWSLEGASVPASRTTAKPPSASGSSKSSQNCAVGALHSHQLLHDASGPPASLSGDPSGPGAPSAADGGGSGDAPSALAASFVSSAP